MDQKPRMAGNLPQSFRSDVERFIAMMSPQEIAAAKSHPERIAHAFTGLGRGEYHWTKETGGYYLPYPEGTYEAALAYVVDRFS